MIYKINFNGYVLVEADTPEEAKDKAFDDDYIEECKEFDAPEEAHED